MSPRPNVEQERREQIMNAAETVFAKKGFDAARMDDIAGQTGLSKGSLYLYFKNKSDLIIGLLERILDRNASRAPDPTDPAPGAEEELQRFADGLIRDVGRAIRLLPISYGFLAMAFRNRTVQESLKRYLNRYLGRLTGIISRGVAEGEFVTVDPGEAAIAIAAMVEGTMLLWVYDHDAVDPERHIRSGLTLLLGGLRS